MSQRLPESMSCWRRPGQAEGGLRELSLGSRGEEQGRVMPMEKLSALIQGEQARSQFAFAKILPCLCLGTHCPGVQDTCPAFCQAVTISYAFFKNRNHF